MKTAIISAAILAAFGVSACATAPASAPQAEAAPATTAKTEMPATDATMTDAKVAETSSDPNREVCRREAVTGSRFKKKICRTAAEWEALREAAKETTGEFQRRSGQSGTKPGGTN